MFCYELLGDFYLGKHLELPHMTVTRVLKRRVVTVPDK